MDVGEKGIGAPAAKHLDGLGIISIEVKGCGSSSSEGVAGDRGWWDALTVQMKFCGCLAEGGSDLTGIDGESSWVLGAEVGANDGVRCVVWTGGDVGDAADESFDGADGGGGGFMMDDSPSLPILLVVNSGSGSSTLLEKGGLWEIDVQELVTCPESDVFESELGCAPALCWLRVGVLPYSEEVEEGNDAEVLLGGLDGGWVGLGLLMEVFKDLDWEGKLGARRWILSVIALEELPDANRPRLAWRSSQEWRFSSQLDGLGDG